MLTMIQVQNIKNIKKYQGKSLRAITRETGYAFETVKKYIEMKDFNDQPKKRKVGETKMDPVKEIVDRWLTDDLSAPPKQRHTAKRIYDRLKEEHGHIFDACYKTVSNYVREKKKKLLNKTNGYIPLDHKPGEAQADFGEVQFYENEKLVKGKYIVLSFPYSNASYFQVFRGENQECLLTGLKNIFEHIGKIPNEIWFDNMKTAVTKIGKKGERTINDKFRKFALHYGFEMNFCNANSGNEKGNVENKVGYNRRNYFVPVPKIKDLKEYNIQLFNKAEKDMDRVHYKIEKKIKELFQEDIKAMQEITPKPFEVFKMKKAKINKYGKLKFETNSYSVSPKRASSEVWVKATYDKVHILDNEYNLIISHERIYGKNKESMKWLPYLELMSKRPTATKYTSFYDELPGNWKGYIKNIGYDEKKEALKMLSQILETHNLDTAEKVLAHNLENGVESPKSLLATYYHMTESKKMYKTIELHKTVPEVTEIDVNLNEYDSLIPQIKEAEHQ